MTNTQSLIKIPQNTTQKLIYRGQVYNLSHQQIMTSSSNLVKLIYRSQSYEKAANSIALTSKKTTKLIYRGQAYYQS